MPTCAGKTRLLLALLLSAAAARAHTSLSSAPVIGEIRIERLDIFNPAAPGENLRLFRAANKIHIVTKEKVVRREILLSPGDRWDPLESLQSERNLRLEGYFRRVEISTVPRADGKLDLLVRTQDSWTTQVQLSVGTEGGDTFFIYGAQEQNLLGYNKTLGFLHSQIGPITRNSVRYKDPRLLGSRYQFSTFYGTNPKGESIGAELRRPFFALDAPWAMETAWSKRTMEHIMFQNAEESTSFVADFRTMSASAGRRLNDHPSWTHRTQAGWYAERARFERTNETRGPLPLAREFSGPTAGYSWVQARFIKETDINIMERVEDFNLGNELRLSAGYMPEATGSDRDRAIFNISDQQGLSLGEGRFLLAQAGITGRAARGKVENAVAFANLNAFVKHSWPLPQTLAFHAEANLGRRLDGENQIVLGGNNGLRGYRNYSFAGTRALLFNLENRFFFPGEYFHLFRLGAAVFMDSGAVAPEGSALGARLFRSDVGAGLRLSSTRSASGRVMRFDVAYALDAPVRTTSRWVFAVKGGQAFSLFNSAGRLARQTPGSTLEMAPPSDPLSPR